MEHSQIAKCFTEMAKQGSQFPDELNIWQLRPAASTSQLESRPDLISKTPRRRVEFGAVGDVDERCFLREERHNRSKSATILTEVPLDDSDANDNKLKSGIFGVVHLLSENIILHPFIVIRRQCQVGRRSFKYHLTPFTVVPLVVMDSKHGIHTLWKGVGSVLITKGLLLASESIIAECSSLNRDLSSCKFNAENVFKHVLLKTIAFTLVTPFLCSSTIETVQSSVASETPGILDCLQEGFVRLTHWRRSPSTRLLPFWVITGPTVVYHLLHYTISSTTKSVIAWWRTKSYCKNGIATEKVNSAEYDEISSTLIGNLTADVILFPLETVICRLYVQGTRTLIDSVDQTNRVIPIISDYEGPVDCYRSIITDEGSCGLFKGLGALVLQYVFHFAILRLTNVVLRELLPHSKKV